MKVGSNYLHDFNLQDGIECYFLVLVLGSCGYKNLQKIHPTQYSAQSLRILGTILFILQFSIILLELILFFILFSSYFFAVLNVTLALFFVYELCYAIQLNQKNFNLRACLKTCQFYTEKVKVVSIQFWCILVQSN